MQPPPIDTRSIQAIAARTAELATAYAAWQPASDGRDSGQALIRIFARMVETIILRLNQVPQNNLLAFLELIGTRLLPPQPARVPLTFTLATGSRSDALVPARTQVLAMPLAGESEPLTFETESDLVVTRTSLSAIFCRDPLHDRYSDYSAALANAAAAPIVAFEGNQPIMHRLLLGFSRLLDQGTAIDLALSFSQISPVAPWLQKINWSYWDGSGWQDLAADQVAGEILQAPPRSARGLLRITNLPPLPISSVENRRAAWLRATLTTPLPHGELLAGDETGSFDLQQTGVSPDVALTVREEPVRETLPQDLRQMIYPFGRSAAFAFFYLAADIAFSKPGARLSIGVELANPAQIAAGTDLQLAWAYWNGQAWQELGRSTVADSEPAPPPAFADTTRAFSRNGSIRFVCPTDWEPQELFDAGKHYWLRVQLAQGSYSIVGEAEPPALRSLVLSYRWPLPRMNRIDAQVVINKAGLPLEAALSDQGPVDLSKDFLPFGPEPAFNATFYLAGDEVFSKPDALVRLLVTLSNPPADTASQSQDDRSQDDTAGLLPAQASSDLRLRWEFWNGEQWDLLGESGAGATPSNYTFIDQSENFTLGENNSATATIRFRCPPTWRPTTVNGLRHSWLRVRIVRGNYGLPARYISRILNRDDAGFVLVPASFRPPSLAAISIDYVYNSASARPEYVLAENDFALVDYSRTTSDLESLFTPFLPPGDSRPVLYLAFDQPDSGPAFANRAGNLYFRVAEPLFEAEQAADAMNALVAWEYWNGRAWARLGVRDETRNLSRRGLLSFIGPADFQRSREFEQEAFWLRAHWDRGSYPALPRLHRILTNTVWAGHTLTNQNEELGSSNGEPNQRFRLVSAPVLAGQRIEMREPALPSNDAAQPGGAAERTATGQAAVWLPWQEVADFLGSGPRSRHYVLNHLSGELRFGDGRAGMIPPVGRANIRAAWYQTGGGSRGNRPAGNINRLGSSVPSIDQVGNYEPAAGGADLEQPTALLERGSRSLRHRNRAVALSDYEDLALAASPAVARARCLPADSAANAGLVRLIVVPQSSIGRPVPSLELLAQVSDALAAHMPPTVDLQVGGPDWLEVVVSAEVVPVRLAAAGDLQATILARLEAFLHPLGGGTDGRGWEFGRRPHRSDLFALLESVAGVSHIRRLEVAVSGTVAAGRFLVYSGAHRITVAMNDD